MWTCLLLFCVQFVIAVTTGSQCPTGCNCIWIDGIAVIVDCQGHPDVDPEELSEQLDSLLSSNLTYGRLWGFEISNSSLTHVPRSVCRLTTLTQLIVNYNRLTRLPQNCFINLSNLTRLIASDNAIETLQDGVFNGQRNLNYLDLGRNRISSIGSICQLTTLTELHVDHNQLTRLPQNCFINLSKLQWLVASDNAIVTLQDGVFDGLRHLYHLDLSRNMISNIGLYVFATSSGLSNLFWIYLSENNLTSLEPWCYDRGLIGSFEQLVYINLTHNKIWKFTNEIGHDLPSLCDRETFYADVDLRYNNIQHFVDILNGWQLDLEGMVRCYAFNSGDINFRFDVSYNNIPCDCINYNFYRTDPLSIADNNMCNFTDPITKKSRIMKVNYADLSQMVCELTERCPAGCVCFRRPQNATLHVYCSNKNLTVIPLELPELPDSRTKYKLDFSNNRLLRRLEHRDYFVKTSILDVSDSGVDDVSDWEEIANIPDVSLFGNKLTSLPRSCLSINSTGKLNLASNPWDCSCDNKWMSDCFSSIAVRLTQKVVCYSPSRLSGKDITQISDEEFCVDPASEAASKAITRTLTISMSSVASVIVFLLLVGVIVYRLRVKLYTRWKFHPFDRDECLGEDMDYDVYFCCSYEDHDPHALRIVQLVESKGYRVCYHDRDFLPGQRIADNISRAIERSKRTICLLSENFLAR